MSKGTMQRDFCFQFFEYIFCNFFWRGRMFWPLLCLCRAFYYFLEMSEFEPRELPQQAGALTTKPPSPTPSLATHLPAQLPISLLSHPFPYCTFIWVIIGTVLLFASYSRSFSYSIWSVAYYRILGAMNHGIDTACIQKSLTSSRIRTKICPITCNRSLFC